MVRSVSSSALITELPTVRDDDGGLDLIGHVDPRLAAGAQIGQHGLDVAGQAVDAAAGIAAARLPAPMTVTPSTTTALSGLDIATLPPSGPAAVSSTIEPGRISLTASSVTSNGGRRPGTAAAVITTSESPI